MGIGEDFSTFCANLTIPSEKRESISYRYKRITKQLNIDCWLSDSDTYHSCYVGSYGRGTAIKGFSDLDMVFQLPKNYYDTYNSYFINGQSSLLQYIRGCIQKTYPSTYIGADGQVVIVEFSDNIKFEIVPGFLNNDGSYAYPDSNDGGKWRITKPTDEINAINYMDKKTNGNLKWLCRMMRSWKNQWSVPMGGLLIDTLAYRFIQDWEYKDKSYLYYDWMSRDFFYYLSQEPENDHWLAVWSNQYIWTEGKFQYKALRCYNLACDAIKYYSQDLTWTARQKWREIYGTAFPD